MDDRTLFVECMKLAASLSSPSMHDRVGFVAQSGKVLYDAVTVLLPSKQSIDETVATADTPKRGRPPKPRADAVEI